MVLASSFAVSRAALSLLDEGREGLATFAIAVNDIGAETARLRAAGSSIRVPVAGQRVRPDGEIVRWIAAFPEPGRADRGRPEPPFPIEQSIAAPSGATPPWRSEPRSATRSVGASGSPGWRSRSRTRRSPRARGHPRSAWPSTATIAPRSGGRPSSWGVGGPTSPTSSLPAVHLVADAGTPSLESGGFGVRWHRHEATAGS